MKNHRFTALMGVALLSSFAVSSAQAQPGVPAPATNARQGARAARQPGALNKRLTRAIEAKTGKTLTADQRARLTQALKVRQAALDAAQEKFATEATAVTGLTADELKAIETPTRRAGAGAAGARAAGAQPGAGAGARAGRGMGRAGRRMGGAVAGGDAAAGAANDVNPGGEATPQ